MGLQKQAVSVNFQQGVDTKIDPFQLPIGKFESLVNSVFDKIGRLTKRNGYGELSPLPDASSTYATTFNGNLTAIGKNLRAFSQGGSSWVTKGSITPLSLTTVSLISNNTNQSYVDTAVASNGLVCVTYTDNITSGSTTAQVHKYAIADSTTGQNIVAPTTIVSPNGATVFSPRVFSLGNNFVVVFSVSSATAFRLQYFSIGATSANMVSSVSDVSANYQANSTGAFDGVVANNSLYLSWSGAANSGILSRYITSNLSLSSAVTIASGSATIVSVTADNTGVTPVVWTSFYVSGSNSGRIVATNQELNTVFSSRLFVDSSTAQVQNIASVANNGSLNLYYEVGNSYSYSSVSSNYINYRSALQATGSLTAETTLVRSVGLASKAFLIGSDSFFLSTYSSPYQSTYFLMNSSGGAVGKLAYGNGSGYLRTALPSVTVFGTQASFGYLYKEEIQAVNKETEVSSTTQVAGIYSQLGIKLANVNFGTNGLVAAETGKNLNLNGGILWAYDGYELVENGFHLYPDNVTVTNPGVVGSLSPQTYYYVATYEWSDNQGNIFRSAPSIPVQVTSSGTLSANVINVPTLRVTKKTANPVKVVLYRWSEAQQAFYQVTSITTPILNSTTTDSISFTDRNSDAAILGNNILYTTGGVLENIGAPAFTSIWTFDSRLWGIFSEDQDLVWFSKKIIQETPVEFSDLQTIYVSPNLSAQGPTGPLACGAPMDDKNILFKKNAIYYINGSGPDATGVNSQYSEPIFITGTVGCENQNSIVSIPLGLMFQSDKGIWLLGRDLSTQYIGKEVEAYNDIEVLSAVTVPGTNQVRFTLANGVTLMYDYLVGQWGEFFGNSGISSTLYQNLHTYINSRGNVYQETPGQYLDGGRPVLMSYRTGWVSLAGLQGYQRLYQIYMLGQYLSPHKFTVGIAYDFDASVSQLVTVEPTNYSGVWGSGTSWGSIATWGGSTKREQWQINAKRQQCQSFQLTFNEYYDPTKGIAAGAGLTLSGLNLTVGLKKSYPGNIGRSNRTG